MKCVDAYKLSHVLTIFFINNKSLCKSDKSSILKKKLILYLYSYSQFMPAVLLNKP